MLRVRVAALGALSVPISSFFRALFHSVTVLIAPAKAALCRGMPLCRGLLIPFHGRGIILMYMPSILITVSQQVLCVGVALFRGRAAFIHAEVILQNAYSVKFAAARCFRFGRIAVSFHRLNLLASICYFFAIPESAAAYVLPSRHPFYIFGKFESVI